MSPLPWLFVTVEARMCYEVILFRDIQWLEAKNVTEFVKVLLILQKWQGESEEQKVPVNNIILAFFFKEWKHCLHRNSIYSIRFNLSTSIITVWYAAFYLEQLSYMQIKGAWLICLMFWASKIHPGFPQVSFACQRFDMRSFTQRLSKYHFCLLPCDTFLSFISAIYISLLLWPFGVTKRFFMSGLRYGVKGLYVA